jgi:tetratricopeptide (TPR) repeat protein
LAIYVFASTATAPKSWQLSGSLKEGVMRHVVSLRLVELLVFKFKDRLFSDDQLKQLISMDAFASRCLNDFGILQPCLENTNDVWQLHEQVVAQELNKALEEMKFMLSYMQIDIEYLATKLEDPAAALVLNAVQAQSSIYNHDRLEAIRFFVRTIQASEQYNILKQYWPLVAQHTNTEDIYRILGQELLIDLATLFERAAMYRDAEMALGYIEHIFPFKAQIGLARLAERQGNFAHSEQILGEMIQGYETGKIPLSKNSYLDLLLNYAWTIVSGRLNSAKEAGEAALDKLQAGLYSNYDELRNSEQMIRYYNIKANYEEWNGRPEGALQCYDKALQIPGVQRAALSNLLVNKGIALRQLQQLAEAAAFGEQGVAVKVALGDADQLPIALHNLAQTYLLLVQQSQQVQQAAMALEHAQHGLAIQARTGSVKKRGQLLAERLVALDLLQAPAAERRAAWQALQDWMRGEIEAGRDQTYDCKVVAKELLPMLSGYEAEDLQAALGFTYLLEH